MQIVLSGWEGAVLRESSGNCFVCSSSLSSLSVLGEGFGSCLTWNRLWNLSLSFSCKAISVYLTV